MEKKAYGAAYCISDLPFEGMSGKSLRGRPWWNGTGPRRIVAGEDSVIVGGDRYNTVANGWSCPVEILPGHAATVELMSPGSPHSFAVWRVTMGD